MAEKPQASTELSQVLNSDDLVRVRQFWFRHITDDDHLIIPSKELAVVWFSQDEKFDQECISSFGNVLEFLSSKINEIGVDEILHATKPASALDWMSLIVLLDQIPRNCYRGEKAAIAYRFFDPLALDLALRAITAGIPERSGMRYRHAYRFWFYLPLEHSEDIQILEMVVKEHDLMFGDSRDLMATGTSVALQGSDASHCRDVLLKGRAALEEWATTIRGIANDHIAVIKAHGRYPHRDRALVRNSVEP